MAAPGRIPAVEPPAVAASPIHEKYKSRWADTSFGSAMQGAPAQSSVGADKTSQHPSSFLPSVSAGSGSVRASADARRVTPSANARASTSSAGTHHTSRPTTSSLAAAAAPTSARRSPSPAARDDAASAPDRDSASRFSEGPEAVTLAPARVASRSKSGPESKGPLPFSPSALTAALVNVEGSQSAALFSSPRPADKASRILGIQHRRSMEPIPASTRTSMVSTHSAPAVNALPPAGPQTPLASLYLVSGLPKSPHTWTLSDTDSVLGMHHSEGAVNRWWRPEVLGSTISPGAGGGKKGLKKKASDLRKGSGALSKQDVGKMLSKALKLSFTREVEIVASTLQPASTVHTFTFNLPASNNPFGTSPSGDLLRNSVFSTASDRTDAHSSPRGGLDPILNPLYSHDPFAAGRPSTAFLGPPSVLGHGGGLPNALTRTGGGAGADQASAMGGGANTVAYHGVCLTVWSHADAERTAAIRRTLETGRARKESSVNSLRAARLKHLRGQPGGDLGAGVDPSVQARRRSKRGAKVPWGADAETDAETEGEGAMSESDYDVASTVGHAPGESTVFLPGDAVFWLPYALTLVSRHPIYDLMRDYLTLSWARFSKDVQSHTLQISKILSHPAPRAGELIKLDASSKNDGPETSLEVIARFPGGMDFGRGLVDTNFTMWPLFKALNVDNILTICEIALAPTGRVLFFSRHPAMLGMAVATIKYLVELRGWSGIALPAVHCRDAKIYIEDPGPWIIGLATEARYSVRPPVEVCIVDLDINYLNCVSPPPGVVSVKQQRDKYRQRLLSAFDPHYHPDHCVPSEFKEAFPAGRFRPVCKIQAKRGASPTAVADVIQPPDWWHSTRIIQAFDSVLQDRTKKPSFFRRISSFGMIKSPPQLTAAEQHIQLSIRKRATAFVDARDDLETKIGRLSRRLNFLMTESDLWRDKFVTFEQYAEKLSAEANELRAKINREQRETKRLSGIVTNSAAEKMKLQSQLRDTESAHVEAQMELQKMKETMDRMEDERAEMIAEVEAQIERALQSMAVGLNEGADDDSEYGDSQDGNSSGTGSATISRKPSLVKQSRHIPSFATESTLAENDSMEELSPRKTDMIKDILVEENEDEDTTLAAPATQKRFSADPGDASYGMHAVDAGISEKSDRIALKVMQIQQKLETALAAEGRASRRKHHGHLESESEYSTDSRAGAYRRPGTGSRSSGKAPKKERKKRMSVGSNLTIASSVSGHTTPLPEVRTDDYDDEEMIAIPDPRNSAHALPRLSTESSKETPTIPEEDYSGSNESSPADMQSPLTPAHLAQPVSVTTDEEDFQSAYSTSPRESYLSARQTKGFAEGMDSGPDSHSSAEEERVDQLTETSLSAFARAQMTTRTGRARVNSASTATQAQPSPTLSEDTVISLSQMRPVAT